MMILGWNNYNYDTHTFPVYMDRMIASGKFDAGV